MEGKMFCFPCIGQKIFQLISLIYSSTIHTVKSCSWNQIAAWNFRFLPTFPNIYGMILKSGPWHWIHDDGIQGRVLCRSRHWEASCSTFILRWKLSRGVRNTGNPFVAVAGNHGLKQQCNWNVRQVYVQQNMQRNEFAQENNVQLNFNLESR